MGRLTAPFAGNLHPKAKVHPRPLRRHAHRSAASPSPRADGSTGVNEVDSDREAEGVFGPWPKKQVA